MHTLLCVCPPRVESLFPPVLSKSCNQIPVAFKVWFSRNSSSHCRTPRLGSLTGSEPSLRGWTSVVQVFSSLWVTHPAFMGFDFTVIAPLLQSHCGFSFVFGCGVSFLVSSSVFLSMIVQQLVVILVFLQEGVRSRPSTPPSWFQSQLLWEESGMASLGPLLRVSKGCNHSFCQSWGLISDSVREGSTSKFTSFFWQWVYLCYLNYVSFSKAQECTFLYSGSLL